MATPNFKVRVHGDRVNASTIRATTRKIDGMEVTVAQRCEGELMVDAVTVHCFARQDGTLMTRVTVKGHKPIELVTNRG